MNKNQFQSFLAAMYCLSRMIQAEQTYPHGGCADTFPTWNICPTCPKHAFCSAKAEFIVNMALLEKAGAE